MAAHTSPLPAAYLGRVRPGDHLQWGARTVRVTHVTAHTIRCDDGTTIRKETAS